MSRMNRWEVATAALDALREHPSMSGVQVSEHHPGEAIKAQAIWVGEISGEITYPVSAGPARRMRDDMFTIPLNVRIAGKSIDAARARIDELTANIDDIFADLLLTLVGDIEDLLSIELDGEPVYDAQDTPIGALAFARIDLLAHSRLT